MGRESMANAPSRMRRRRSLTREMRRAVSEGLSEVKRAGLGLGVDVVEVAPKVIEVWQDVAPAQVDRVAFRMRLAGGWPDDLPLIVLGRWTDGSYEGVLDGNHRLAASLQAGLDRIPALAVDFETFELLSGLGASLNEIWEIFAAESPEMNENQDLRWFSGEDVT